MHRTPPADPPEQTEPRTGIPKPMSTALRITSHMSSKSVKSKYRSKEDSRPKD